MKKRYRLESGMDISITLEIDTDKLGEPMAAEINGFWSGASDVLAASRDDVHQAVARRAAGPLLAHLLDGYNEAGAVAQLGEAEGWPSTEDGWIAIVDHEVPELDALSFNLRTAR